MHDDVVTANEILSALQYPEDERCACYDDQLLRIIYDAKALAVAHCDEREAFWLWCAQTIYSVQRGFISAFAKLQASSYYEAWCEFERCEIDLLFLNRHFQNSDEDPHRIEYIGKMVSRWQSIYPYKVFLSPEFLIKRVECSICGAKVSPRSCCGHDKQNIYMGEMCYHKVTEMEGLGVSLVENPVQRYSVAFLTDKQGGESADLYNYKSVKFVVENVVSPFQGWESARSTRTIHASEIAHLDAHHECPCQSGKNFGACCKGNDHLVVSHLQIQIYAPPTFRALDEMHSCISG